MSVLMNKQGGIIVGKDKILHFIVGIFIVILSSTFGLNKIFSFILVLIAGIGKEIYDSFYPSKHTVESYDAIATIVGGLLATYFIL